MTGWRTRRRVVVAGLVLVLLPGCGAGAPRISRSGEPAPTSTAAPVSSSPVPTPTSPVPVAEPAELRIGAIDFGRPATATVRVRPARRPVTFGRTELRGNAAYELSADTCSGQRLLPTGDGCRLEVTVLSRVTGEVAARLVLPSDAGALSVPVTATVPLSYTVTLSVLGAGTVTGDLAGVSCSGRCSARVAQGSALTLTSSAPVRWGGACATAGVGTACRVTVDTPLEITADFR